jgi:hypothetical protein
LPACARRAFSNIVSNARLIHITNPSTLRVKAVEDDNLDYTSTAAAVCGGVVVLLRGEAGDALFECRNSITANR